VFNDQDRGRVQSIIDLGVGEKDLKHAWLLFLKSRDSWLEGKPRSIAIFKSQANDYLAAIPNPAPPPGLLETRLGSEEALEDEIMALWESWDNETDSCSNIHKRAQEILSREDISRSQIDALRFILEKVEEGEGFELEDEFVKA